MIDIMNDLLKEYNHSHAAKLWRAQIRRLDGKVNVNNKCAQCTITYIYSLDRFNVLMLEIKLLIEHVFNKIAYNNINIA